MVIMSQMNREFGVSSAFAYETHHGASTNKELSDSWQQFIDFDA